MTDMDEIVEFLTARLEEREESSGRIHRVSKLFPEDACWRGISGGQACDCPEPERIRREVAAQRAILGFWETAERNAADEGLEYMTLVVKELVAVYAEHPEFKDDWIKW